MSLLRIQGLSLQFGGIKVLRQVDCQIDAGSICGLIGPNGAGKTSLFNCITGSYTPDAGSVLLTLQNDTATDLVRTAPHRLAGLGVARTFQHPILDAAATALQNVLWGGHIRLPRHPLSPIYKPPAVRRAEAELSAAADAVMDELGLTRWRAAPAGSLPYAVQKKLELARALLIRPRLLLLDEPAGGLAQGEVDELEASLRSVRDRHGIAILLVEHHMGLVSRLTDKVVALVEGQVVVEGTVAAVQRHPVILEAYLGLAA
jgi:branched-chain amino acid transport system ATP-binding protein